MKITSYESAALNIPEDDPLANMPEEVGRTRPVVILRLRTDAGIEGIGVTLWGGRLSGSLRAAVDELAAQTIGEDPRRIENIIAGLRGAAGSSGGPGGIFTLALAAMGYCAVGCHGPGRGAARCGSCWVAIATASTPMRRARCAAG